MNRDTTWSRNLGRGMRAILLAAVGLGFAAAAEARTEVLVWNHPNPSEVDRFRVHWDVRSHARGNLADSQDPYPNRWDRSPTRSGNRYTTQLQLPSQYDNRTLYFRVSALGRNGVWGPKSNEIVRRPQASPPSPPPPSPPPSGGGNVTLGQPGQPVLVP